MTQFLNDIVFGYVKKKLGSHFTNTEFAQY